MKRIMPVFLLEPFARPIARHLGMIQSLERAQLPTLGSRMFETIPIGGNNGSYL